MGFIAAHRQVREPVALSRHRLIKPEFPDEISRDSVDESQLPTDWSRRVSVTRAWGDINPRHADATRIQRLTSFPYPLDSRLL